jgi:hypothetical protein
MYEVLTEKYGRADVFKTRQPDQAFAVYEAHAGRGYRVVLSYKED